MVGAIQNSLWATTVVVQALLTIVMVRCGAYREYRAFFSYIAFQALKSFCLVAIGREHGWTYFWTYWIAELVSLILALAVLQEIFEGLTDEEPRIKRVAASVFWSTAIAVLMTVALTLKFSPGRFESGLMTGVLTGERAMRTVQSGLLLFVFGFSWVTKVPWRAHARSIAVGMGTFIAAELVIVTMREVYGPDFRLGFQLLKPFSYDIALLVWLHSFVFARALRSQGDPPAALATLNHKLLDILR
jgi:hypothetical protein